MTHARWWCRSPFDRIARDLSAYTDVADLEKRIAELFGQVVEGVIIYKMVGIHVILCASIYLVMCESFLSVLRASHAPDKTACLGA